MGVVAPYAVSVHTFVTKVGDYVAFAAILAVAILVLMLFAHARETAALRRRADEAEDQLHSLEAYVNQLSRSTAAQSAGPQAPVAASPAPAPAVGRVAAARTATGAPVSSRVAPAPAVSALSSVSARGLAPAAPAGVAGPALSAATRLIPAAEVTAPPPAAPAAVPSPAPVATGLTTAAVLDPPSPPPSTAAAGGNGVGGGRATPPPSPPAPRPAQRPLPPRSAPPRAAPAPRRDYRAGSGGSRFGRGAIAVATVLLAVVIVAVLLVVTHSSGGNSTPTVASHASKTTNAPTTTKKKTKGGKVTVVPSSVTVAVLNGTATANLAHDVSAKLSQVGYKPGSTGNASSQSLTSTIVGYLPGFHAQALAVAQSLHLGSSSVQGVDPSDRAVACSSSQTACPDQVVVTVGSDLNSLA